MNGISRGKKLAIWNAVVVCTALPIVMIGYQEGPDPANTAAPNESGSACARSGCHTGTGNPAANSTAIEVVFPNGPVYTPGVKQHLKVQIASSSTLSPTNGFQLSIRPASNANAQAGDLTPTDSKTQVICLTGSSQPCDASAPVQFIEHTFSGSNSREWEFDWTPPASSVGDIKIYLAVNAANGNGSNSGDRIHLRNYTLTAQNSTVPGPTIGTGGLVQSFLGGSTVSSGTWLEIYGTNLAPSEMDWTAALTATPNQAPATLNGVSVNVGGKVAFLNYAGAGQVNVQVPDGIGTGPQQVELINANGRTTANVTVATASPALLTTPDFKVGDKQYVVAFDGVKLNTGEKVFIGKPGTIPIAGAAFQVGKPNDVITIFTVGCGATTPASPSGTRVTDTTLHTVPVSLLFGQVPVTAQGFMSPGNFGLCQVNATIPNIAPGDYAITGTINGAELVTNLTINLQQ